MTVPHSNVGQKQQLNIDSLSLLTWKCGRQCAFIFAMVINGQLQKWTALKEGKQALIPIISSTSPFSPCGFEASQLLPDMF